MNRQAQLLLLGAVVLSFYLPALYSAPSGPRLTESSLTSKITGVTYFHFNCTLCEMGVKMLQWMLKLHVSYETISRDILHICETFHIEDRPVCQGVVTEFKEELLSVISGSDLSAADTCVMMFGDICSKSAYDPEVNWNVQFPVGPAKQGYITPRQPSNGDPKLRVLQLSDIHLDHKYKAGANAACKEPLCCRLASGAPAKESDRAGYWGDYRNCDLPEYTLDNLLKHLATNEKFDMIYWTGDLPPHDIWNQTRESQIEVLQTLTNKLLTYFPNTPIYPAVGNHESAPVDSFPPPFITGNKSESWLYKALSKSWAHWLPESSLDTVNYGAYYTVLIKTGFRIVSINTNYCDHRNWWLLLNATDPAGELKWLIKILQSAEDKQEKVHIIGHIPPGDSDCYRVWSRNYNEIVFRYANTITAQFFGHTHYDEYEIMYDHQTSQPVSIAYVAPSVTTYRAMNPGYRVYTIDGFYPNSSWAAIDHETVIMNITEANANNKTVWKKEYSAKEAFGLPDLTPRSWQLLAQRMYFNETLFEQYRRFYFKSNLPEEKCDKTCKDAMLCSLHMATFGDRKFCDDMESSVDAILKHKLAKKVC